jgi:hypothetical protein
MSRLPLPEVIDAADWPEMSYRLGLTDGLPTFPPERAAVERLIAGSGLAADHVVGAIPPAGTDATVSAVAANAAMAGCLPEHMPVVITALEAMLEPSFNLAGVVTTTHPCWPLIIVSGPAVTDLGMATAESVFNGGGSRANLAIGRAVRLVTWNLGGALPRAPVQEILGHPGRLAFCIAEEPINTPWPSLAEARGVEAQHGSVTVFACEAPQIVNLWGIATTANPRVGEQWLAIMAEQMCTRGSNNTHTMGEILVVFTPSMARVLDDEGWTRRSIQDFLWKTSSRRLGDIRLRSDDSPALDAASAYEWWPDWLDQTDAETRVPVTASAESIHVMVTGADSIPCGAVCPSWGHLGGFAVTRPIPGPARTKEQMP